MKNDLRRKTISYFLFMAFFMPAWLAAWAQPSVYRNEKIYLAAEKEYLYPGDTFSVYGWVVEAQTFALSPYSRYVYLECLDSRDSVLVRQKIDCPSGRFRGRIPVDLFQAPGPAYIRAYTRLMRNQPEWSFPLLPLQIGKPGGEAQAIPVAGREVHTVRFYPEGGRLVAGCLQQVVFETTDPSGRPVETVAELIDSQGNILQSGLTTEASGRGCIRFIPLEGETYRLRFPSQAVSESSRLYPLPAAGHQPTLQLNLNRGKLRYTLLSPSVSRQPYGIALFYRGIFLAKDTLSPDRPTALLDLSAYPSGICAALLLDEENQVIAERLIFHLGNEYLTGERDEEEMLFRTDKTVYRPGETARLSWMRSDSAAAYQVRIREIAIDPGVSGTPDSFSLPGRDIVSYLLLTSEFPASCFPFSGYRAPRLATALQEIDKWLIAGRWKRFPLPEVMQGTHVYSFSPEKGILLEGRVETELGNPLKKGSLVAINRDTGFTYEGTIDAGGRFRVAVDDFPDGQTFFMQACDRKGKTFAYKVIPDPETYPGVDNRLKKRSVEKKPDSLSSSSVRIASGEITAYYEAGEEKKYRLPEIEVAARIRKEAPETQDFYFQRKITQELIQKRSYPDLIPYLEDLSGIRVGKVSLNPNAAEDDLSIFRYAIFTTRGAAVLKKQSDPYQRQAGELPVLLDGTLVDTHHVLTTLDPQIVASVERLTPGQALAYTSFGFDGAILIKTRGYRKEKPLSKGVQWQPLGLSRLSESPRGLPDSFPLPRKAGVYLLVAEGIDAAGVPRSQAKQIVIQE